MAMIHKCTKCGHEDKVPEGVTEHVRMWAAEYFKANPEASNDKCTKAYLAKFPDAAIATVQTQVRNAR